MAERIGAATMAKGKGDKQGAIWFKGADCVLCTRPGWKVKTKHFDGL